MQGKFRKNNPTAFTLVELLVVMAVLAMVLAIAVPMFGRAVEISRSAKCKTNLHNLTSALHAEDDSRKLGLPGGSVHTIPTSCRWLDFIAEQGLTKLLLCPSETAKRDPMRNLRNLWVRQNGYTWSENPDIHYSNLKDLLSGGPIPDWQVAAWYKGTQYGTSYQGWQWVEDLNGGPAEDNQAFVTIATCAAFLITINEETIDLTPLGHAPNWNSGSNHWITKGDPDEDNWESTVLVQLTGMGCPNANPGVTVFGGDCHYGMSNLVPTRNYLLSQLWLTEYSDDIMKLSTSHRDDPFDDDRSNGEILARHFGRANCARVDGGVISMTKPELEAEFDKIDTGCNNIFQSSRN